MIDEETKEKLLREIEKNGNVSLSCAKVGVDKATFYRWWKNKSFKKKADEAIKRGRETNCDFAESALMILVKQQKLEAIKYQLSHNSPIYKRNLTDYKFSYEKIVPPGPPQKTLEDLIKEDNERLNNLSLEDLREKFPQIPKVITPHELVNEFMEESAKRKKMEEEEKLKTVPLDELRKRFPQIPKAPTAYEAFREFDKEIEAEEKIEIENQKIESEEEKQLPEISNTENISEKDIPKKTPPPRRPRPRNHMDRFD